MLYAVAEKLDRLGLRPLIARAATLAYAEQSFSVDTDGHWVNRQKECAIISPTIHTARYSAIRERILDHWCWDYMPQQGDIIIDCGAGVGEEAVVFSSLAGQILSIEAHPETYACLAKTVQRSGFNNVVPIHCAVADKSGTAFIDSNDIASSIMRTGNIRVPQRTIAELAANLPRIDLLRMNIEGAEKLAVHGVPWAKVRNVAISCHDFCGLPSKAEVRSVLESKGFAIRTREVPQGQPWIADYLYAKCRSDRA